MPSPVLPRSHDLQNTQKHDYKGHDQGSQDQRSDPFTPPRKSVTHDPALIVGRLRRLGLGLRVLTEAVSSNGHADIEQQRHTDDPSATGVASQSRISPPSRSAQNLPGPTRQDERRLHAIVARSTVCIRAVAVPNEETAGA